MIEDEGMTDEQCDAAIAECIARGWMEKSGTNENGEILFKLTEKGKKHFEEEIMPRALPS